MRLGVAMIAVGVALAVPASAGATVIDLASAPGSVRLDGGAANDAAGFRVADAGDVNGDGRPDLIVGATLADNHDRTDSGAAYVVYGGTDLAHVDLANLGAAGFEIDGSGSFEGLGSAVAGGGDVNGDGIADVIVGAPGAGAGSTLNSGVAYVIYGQRKADPADVDLANIEGTQEFRGLRIAGVASFDRTGAAVAGAGDLNGDGVDDVIVGAPGAGANDRAGSGSAYVVYGQTTADPADVDLSELSTTEAARGFVIDGATAGDETGAAVAAGGDFNGDGHPDAIVGAPIAGANDRSGAGSAYVIYGQATADPADLDLAEITTTAASRGLRIDGPAGEEVGIAVADAGDLNGDGNQDLIVGAPQAGNNGRASSGSVYVVYGEDAADPADVDLAEITTAEAARGLRIDGAAAGDDVGLAVAPTGDVNGDGRPDAIVGAPGAGNNGRGGSGSAYVVYGQAKPDPADLDLATIPTTATARGLRIDGPSPGDLAGLAVAGGDDLNGDGRADVIVGSPFDDSSSVVSGSAYVVDDLIAPKTKVDAAPRLTNDATPTFAFHASEPASFQCSIDQGSPSFAPCSGPGATDTPAAPLADGSYQFRVFATDATGNVERSAATKNFTVDTTPPQTKLTEHPRKTVKVAPSEQRAEVSFGFSSSEAGSTFSCAINGRSPASCRTPRSFELAPGSHSFSVTAIDAAGNPDPTPARFEFTVTAPATTASR